MPGYFLAYGVRNQHRQRVFDGQNNIVTSGCLHRSRRLAEHQAPQLSLQLLDLTRRIVSRKLAQQTGNHAQRVMRFIIALGVRVLAYIAVANGNHVINHLPHPQMPRMPKMGLEHFTPVIPHRPQHIRRVGGISQR